MRRWLVLVSAVFHLTLVFGLFVAGFWKLEQLDRPRISVALSQPLPPPPAPAGGAAPTKAPELTNKTPKTIPHELTQRVEKLPDSTKPVETVTPGGGEGSGEGSGRGSGDPLSKSDCLDDCGPGEGSGSAKAVDKTIEHHDDVVVPPSVIRGMRISGDTQPHPSDNDKTAMARDGKDRVIAVYKTCVDERGSVASVTMLKSSGYPGYDAVISQAMFGWRYKPYEIGGQAVKACGIVTFIYQIK